MALFKFDFNFNFNLVLVSALGRSVNSALQMFNACYCGDDYDEDMYFVGSWQALWLYHFFIEYFLSL